jgi:hypothetical protein
VARLSEIAGHLYPWPEGGVGHRLAADEPDWHDAGPNVEPVVGLAVHWWPRTHLLTERLEGTDDPATANGQGAQQISLR